MDTTRSHAGYISGVEVSQYSLKNDHGMELRVINYGGIVTHLYVPDKMGVKRDIILGFDTMEEYLGEHPFFGAIVGRYGNRIANGKFEIDGNAYQLPVNNGGHCLHGGIETFSHKIWNIEPFEEKDKIGLKLSMTSPDGDQAFPGNLNVVVEYLIDNANTWEIRYYATTDKSTVVNMTQHAYFNLNGHDGGSVLDHLLQLYADHYTPVDVSMIPTGEIFSVQRTPFDFRSGQKIGLNMDGGLDPMIDSARGYDLNYVLNGEPGLLREVAKLTSVDSGITMTVSTTEPGAQLYIGNWLDGMQGKRGIKYQPYHGVCIETQHFPDAPNHPEFPSTLLKPGEQWESVTSYSFSIKK